MSQVVVEGRFSFAAEKLTLHLHNLQQQSACASAVLSRRCRPISRYPHFLNKTFKTHPFAPPGVGRLRPPAGREALRPARLQSASAHQRVEVPLLAELNAGNGKLDGQGLKTGKTRPARPLKRCENRGGAGVDGRELRGALQSRTGTTVAIANPLQIETPALLDHKSRASAARLRCSGQWPRLTPPLLEQARPRHGQKEILHPVNDGIMDDVDAKDAGAEAVHPRAARFGKAQEHRQRRRRFDAAQQTENEKSLYADELYASARACWQGQG